jgi:hypothetical protein
LFGGIAFMGFLLSFGIRSEELEAEEWDEGSEEEESEADEEHGGGSSSSPLLGRR